MKHQFVTTGPENLGFGHGQHACPGGFFASNEIKVVPVEMLRRYDVALKDDGGSGARPKTIGAGTSYFPDPTAKVYFRKRRNIRV